MIDPDFKPETNQRLASLDDNKEYGYGFRPTEDSSIGQYYLQKGNAKGRPGVPTPSSNPTPNPNPVPNPDPAQSTPGTTGETNSTSQYEDNYYYFAHSGNGLVPFDIKNNEVKQVDPRLIHTPIDLSLEKPFGEYTDEQLQEFYAVYDNEARTRMIEHSGEEMDPDDDFIERLNALTAEMKHRKEHVREHEATQNVEAEIEQPAIEITRSSKQLDSDLRRLEDRYDELLEKQNEAIATYGEDSKEAKEAMEAATKQMKKIISKGQEKANVQAAELSRDKEKLTDKQFQNKYVGAEARKSHAKLINGDASLYNPSATMGDITTTNALSATENRPAWTDASAEVEGQIDRKNSPLKQIIKEHPEDYPRFNNNGGTSNPGETTPVGTPEVPTIPETPTVPEEPTVQSGTTPEGENEELTPLEQEQADIIAKAFQKEPHSHSWTQKEDVNLGHDDDQIYIDLGIESPEQAIGPDGKVYYNLEQVQQALLGLQKSTKGQTFRILNEKGKLVKYRMSKRRIKNLQKYLKDAAKVYIGYQEQFENGEDDIRKRGIQGLNPDTGRAVGHIEDVGSTNLGKLGSEEHENMNSGAYVSRDDLLKYGISNVFVRKAPWGLLAAPLVLAPLVPFPSEQTVGEITETNQIEEEVTTTSELAIGDQVVVPEGLQYFYTSRLDNPSGVVGRNISNDTTCTVNSFAIYDSNNELIYANHLRDNDMLPYASTYEEAIEQLKDSGAIQDENGLTVRVHLQQGDEYSNEQNSYLGWITLDQFEQMKADGRVTSIGKNTEVTQQSSSEERSFELIDANVDSNGDVGIRFTDTGEETRIPNNVLLQGTTFKIVDPNTGEESIGQVHDVQTERTVKNIFGMTLKKETKDYATGEVINANATSQEAADAALEGIKR